MGWDGEVIHAADGAAIAEHHTVHINVAVRALLVGADGSSIAFVAFVPAFLAITIIVARGFVIG